MPLTEFLNRLLNFKKSLNVRMRELLLKYNSDKFDSYLPYIISLKSKKILEYVNKRENSIEEKVDSWFEYNKLLINICKECYNRFNPTLIYTFNDEIHLVFYNNNNNNMYLENINEKLTTIVSYVTYLITKSSKYENFSFYGKYVQFNTQYETLNYLIWRQLDCKRNNTNELYRYYTQDSIISIEQKIKKLEDNMIDEILHNIIYGNILKKELIYIEDKNKDLVSRKVITNSNILFSNNFTENLQKYIYNKYI